MKVTVIRVMPDCPDGKTCPALAETDRGSCIVVGKVVREAGVLDTLGIGDDEMAVEVPAALLGR